MTTELDRSKEIQKITGLSPTNFSDLIRAAQLVSDPGGGIFGKSVHPDWDFLGVSSGVADNLRTLGQRYRFSLPHISPAVIWDQLAPETRSWMIENRNYLWQFEELFPALDED